VTTLKLVLNVTLLSTNKTDYVKLTVMNPTTWILLTTLANLVNSIVRTAPILKLAINVKKTSSSKITLVLMNVELDTMKTLKPEFAMNVLTTVIIALKRVNFVINVIITASTMQIIMNVEKVAQMVTTKILIPELVTSVVLNTVETVPPMLMYVMLVLLLKFYSRTRVSTIVTPTMDST
jgi:hypothetical protein